jgi:type II secretory pathway pseudopilin PulG
VIIRQLKRSRQQGFSLIEFTVSATVFTIAFGAIMMNLVVGMALRQSTRELSIAIEGAQSAAETLRGEDFSDIFARYNANPNDDPLVPGSGPGSGFAIPGLTPQANDPDGLAGQIIFPGDGTSLFESVNDLRAGMPRDLNADGVVDLLDHSLDYSNLPIRIRIAWRGRGGDRSIDVLTTLSGV